MNSESEDESEVEEPESEESEEPVLVTNSRGGRRQVPVV